MNTKTNIKIIYWGENLGSPRREKRYMYFIIWKDGKAIESEAEIDALKEELRSILWDEPRLDLAPWWEYRKCEYCYKRFIYEKEKLKRNEYVWRRSMCLRHYFIKHLSKLPSYDTNHPRALIIEDGIAYAIVESVNYRYRIEVDTEKAIMRVKYKNKEYIFTYRNHYDAYPYLSSYQLLKFIVYSKFREILSEAWHKFDWECVSYSNYVINSKLIPACPPENK
jgi:hypothetical protein